MARERRLLFGSVAGLYDRARPGYPDALVDRVLDYVAPCERALEVGAGTGKATRSFAARGLAVHALEPSAEMAAVWRANGRDLPGCEIEETAFEDFDSGEERFRLIFSAQAWHWVAPDVRYVRARALLEPGGALALFWNRARWGSHPLTSALRSAYDRVVPDFGPLPGPMYPSDDTPPALWGDWVGEIERAGGFAEPEKDAVDWPCEYSRSGYLDLIRTHSDHASLAPDRLAALLDAVGEVIDRAGGSITVDYTALLLLARAR